jgi:hypothetical protein
MSKFAEQRVANGVQWLNAYSPGWRDKISLVEFDIGSQCNCVIGQVFGDNYEVSIDKIGMNQLQAQNLGFDAAYGPDNYTTQSIQDDYHNLQKAWTQVLKDVP